jgi:hypothetical protein
MSCPVDPESIMKPKCTLNTGTLAWNLKATCEVGKECPSTGNNASFNGTAIENCTVTVDSATSIVTGVSGIGCPVDQFSCVCPMPVTGLWQMDWTQSDEGTPVTPSTGGKPTCAAAASAPSGSDGKAADKYCTSAGAPTSYCNTANDSKQGSCAGSGPAGLCCT